MQNIYADLHIHLGSARGKPVKITASRRLQLYTVLFEDAPRKGLDMVGVVDTASPLVASEVEEMLRCGMLREHPQGGFTASNGVAFIPACEVETREGFHVLLYLPGMQSVSRLQQYLKGRVTNLTLSTQRADCSIVDLINLNVLLEGIICPAHAFTPHKGVYGCWTPRLKDAIGKDFTMLSTLELGLSADTDMAGLIGETRHMSFLSNSDAHSSGNVGREYNLLQVADKNFEELRMCLENRNGRQVIANYGMDPLMGKYHRSYCLHCHTIATQPVPVNVCPSCSSQRMVMGVWDRIMAIREFDAPRQPVGRARYYYRVPLKDLPGMGPKILRRLQYAFPSEIYVAEQAPIDSLTSVVGPRLALMIEQMRKGRLHIQPGGGGYYGKVQKLQPDK